jgi:hypothetical protein
VTVAAADEERAEYQRIGGAFAGFLGVMPFALRSSNSSSRTSSCARRARGTRPRRRGRRSHPGRLDEHGMHDFCAARAAAAWRTRGSCDSGSTTRRCSLRAFSSISSRRFKGASVRSSTLCGTSSSSRSTASPCVLPCASVRKRRGAASAEAVLEDEIEQAQVVGSYRFTAPALMPAMCRRTSSAESCSFRNAYAASERAITPTFEPAPLSPERAVAMRARGTLGMFGITTSRVRRAPRSSPCARARARSR